MDNIWWVCAAGSPKPLPCSWPAFGKIWIPCPLSLGCTCKIYTWSLCPWLNGLKLNDIFVLCLTKVTWNCTLNCGTHRLYIPYLPVYNAHFFLTNLASKIEMSIIHGNFCFHVTGNLHNNTKSAKSNNSQFYAISRNKSRQKVCLALFITSVHICHGISHATCSQSRLKNLLHFLEYFDDKVNSMKIFLGFVEVRSTHLFSGFFNKWRKIWKRKNHANLLHSTILNSYHVAASLVPGQMLQALCKWIVFNRAAAKQQKKKRRKHCKTWCITGQTEH